MNAPRSFKLKWAGSSTLSWFLCSFSLLPCQLCPFASYTFLSRYSYTLSLVFSPSSPTSSSISDLPSKGSFSISILRDFWVSNF